jgi:predicted transcriptional regulator
MRTHGTRDRILIALTGPRCARELADGLGLHVRAVQTAIGRLAEDNLVDCVTPDLTQARLYSLTGLGRTKRYDLTRENIVDEPPIDWDVYACIQSGSYRRRILTALDGTLTVRQIRKSLVEQGCGMQQSHIHSTLADMQAWDLVTKEDRQGWRTTPAGSTMRNYMLALTNPQTASGAGHRSAADRGAGRSGPAA